MPECAVEKEPTTEIEVKFDSVNDAFLSAFYKVDPKYYIDVLTSTQCLSSRIAAVQGLFASEFFRGSINNSNLSVFIDDLRVDGDARTKHGAARLTGGKIPRERFRESSLFRLILGAEGIPDTDKNRLLDSDEFMFNNGLDWSYGEIFGDNYVDEAIDLLRYVYKHSFTNGSHLPNELKLLIRTAQDMYEAIFNIIEQQKKDGQISNIDTLSLLFGADINLFADKVKELDGPLHERYKEFVDSIFDNLPEFLAAWPEDLRHPIMMSLLNQVASVVHGLYGICSGHRAFEANIGNIQLDHEFTECDALEAMSAIETTVKEIAGVVAPDVLVVNSLKFEGFKRYRYIKPDGTARVVCHIRPRPNEQFDPNYEHGKPNRGVEASFGFTVSRLSLAPIRRIESSRRDDVISVRVDREGRSPHQRREDTLGDIDPTAQVGTLSFDFGSILGNPNNIGTKVAKFLSYCEQQRYGFSPDDPLLNHSPNYFPVGDIDSVGETFSAEVERLDKRARASRPKLAQLAIARAS